MGYQEQPNARDVDQWRELIYKLGDIAPTSLQLNGDLRVRMSPVFAVPDSALQKTTPVDPPTTRSGSRGG